MIHLYKSALLSLLILIPFAAMADEPRPADNSTKAPSLDTIKNLVGTWVALGEDGQPTDQVVSEYRITAGGSAVIETLFPGSDKEMVSMYHQEGDKLVLTHYCMLGNRPRMLGQWDAQHDNRLVFECTGEGLDCEHDRHMHRGVISRADDDHIQSHWTMLEEGKNVYEVKFDLVRVKQ